MAAQPGIGLAVGINTEKARSGFREFKAWLAQEASGISVSINEAALHGSVGRALRKSSYSLDIDVKDIEDKVSASVKRALAARYDVGINAAQLQTTIRENVEAALSNVKMSVAAQVAASGAAPGATGALATSELKTTINQILRPAVDELTKAAAAITASIRAARVRTEEKQKAAEAKAAEESAPVRRRVASESLAVTDPNTGVRTAVRTSLSDPEKVKEQIEAQRALQQAEKEAIAAEKQAQKELEQANREAQASAKRAAAEAQRDSNANFRARMAQRRAESREAAQAQRELDQADREAQAAAKRSAAEAQRDSNETFRARMAQRRAEAREAAQAKRELEQADREAQASAKRAAAEAQRDSNETFRARMAQRRAEAREAAQAKRELEQADREAQASAKRAAAEAQRDSNANFRARMAQRRAEAKEAAEQEANLVRAMTVARNSSITSSRAEGVTGTEARVVAARQLIGQFGGSTEGLEKVRAFLKDDAIFNAAQGLLQLGNGTKTATKGLKDVGDAAKDGHPKINAWKDAANDAHSASRGLAGSLGLLWTTWGSTVPIVAAAAIGAAMRGTYEEGKRVQYQLAFIKGLSGEALTTDEFKSAVSGSMFGSKDAADGLRALTQSGLSAKDAIAALPQVLQLATVGETSVSEAAFAATGVFKAFGLGIGDVGRVSDVMAKAAAESNASVTDMMEAFKYASPAASMYGQTLEETGAALAILSEKNIKGSMAGTAHMNLLREIYTPTKKAGEAFKALGLNMEEMQRRGMTSVEMIDEIRRKTSTLDSAGLKTFMQAVGGERGMRELAPLLTAGTESLKEMQDKLRNSAGFTKQVMAELSNTVEASQQRMKQSLSFSLAETFDNNSAAVQRFNDTLARAFASEEFRNALERLASSVVGVTRFLVDHAQVIAMVAAGYAGLRLASAVAAGFEQLGMSTMRLTGALGTNIAALVGQEAALMRTARAQSAAAVAEAQANSVRFSTVPAAAAAATGSMAVATGAVGALSRGLAMLAGPVGIAITLFTTLGSLMSVFASGNDRARESSDALSNSIDNTNRLLDQELRRLKERRAVLDGTAKSAAAASAMTNVAMGEQSVSSWRKAYEQARAAEKKDMEQFQSNASMYVGEAAPILLPQRGKETYNVVDSEGKVLQVSRDDVLRYGKDDLPKQEEGLAKIRSTLPEIDRLTAVNNNADAIKALNDWANEKRFLLNNRLSETKDKGTQAKIEQALRTIDSFVNNQGVLASLTDTQSVSFTTRKLDMMVDKAGGNTFKLPDTKAIKAAAALERRDALADIAEMEAAYRRQTQALDENYRQQEEIVRAREQAKLITSEEAAARIEKLERESLQRRRELAVQDLAQIRAFADAKRDEKGPDGKPVIDGPKREQIETKIKDLEAQVKKLDGEAQAAIDKAAIKVEGRLQAIRDKSRESAVDGVIRDLDALREIVGKADQFQMGVFGKMDARVEQTLYPKQYVDRASTVGFDEAQRAAIANQRDATARANFENGLAKKLNSDLKLRGTGAIDESFKAGMEAYNSWAGSIREMARTVDQAETDVERLNKRRSDVEASLLNATSDIARDRLMGELDTLKKASDDAMSRLGVAKDELAKLEQLRAISVETRTKAAEAAYEYNRSAEAGLLSFWKSYTKEVGDNAKLVTNIMDRAATDIEQGIVRWTQNGKVNIAEFFKSILASQAALVTGAVVRQSLAGIITGIKDAWLSRGRGADTGGVVDLGVANTAGESFRAAEITARNAGAGEGLVAQKLLTTATTEASIGTRTLGGTSTDAAISVGNFGRTLDMVAAQMSSGAMSNGVASSLGGAGFFASTGALGTGLEGLSPDVLSYFFHDGGLTNKPGRAEMLPSSMFANAPRFHRGRGANLGPRELAAVLLDDEEVLTSRDPRHSRNIERAASYSYEPQWTPRQEPVPQPQQQKPFDLSKIEVISKGTPQKASGVQMSSEGALQIMIEDAVANSVSGGGKVAKAMEGTYPGLQRRTPVRG